MNLLNKLKVVVIRRLGKSLSLPNLETRLQALEHRAPIADSRLDRIGAIFDEATDALAKIKSFQKLSDIHFQTLFDQLEIEKEKLTIFIEESNTQKNAMKEQLLAFIAKTESYQITAKQESATYRDEAKTHQVETKTLQNELSTHQVETKTLQNELRAHQDAAE